MKKVILILLLAAATYKVKAQQSMRITPPSAFQPLIADSINFKSLYLTKSSHKKSKAAINAPNLQKQIDRVRFQEMLAAGKPKSRMPVAVLSIRDRMPVHRTPDSAKYHMLIKGNKQADTTAVKINP